MEFVENKNSWIRKVGKFENEIFSVVQKLVCLRFYSNTDRVFGRNSAKSKSDLSQ